MLDISDKIITFYNRIKKEAILGRLLFLIVYTLLSIYRVLINNKNSLSNKWLIGENGGACVKDNGYYFFQFCKNEKPDRSVYFVINKHSAFYKELSHDNRVIIFGSLKHVFIYSVADICFYTHTFRDFIYNPFYKIFKKPKRLVYLHHGFLGFKKLDYKAASIINKMDIFIVGNLLEKKILLNHVETNEEKIKVTGYPRFDWIRNTATIKNKQILYIPTQRNPYLKGNIRSYLSMINSFLNNSELIRTLNSSNIVMKVCFHQGMLDFTNNILSKSKNIEIIKYGQQSVTSLIQESNLMITDYSSVSWDFFFLEKPVIFYRFDIQAYHEDRSSYLSLEEEIIGDVVFEESNLVMTIKQYSDNDFKIKNKYLAYKNKIFTVNDYNNCKRIFDIVDKLQ